ncbi:MAG: host-nuclease inhibitor Gam family protein [Desulfovibrio sp.]|jgi:phage host-nuclease inhibitor protein Gam|nr:host-nuclease inhibitor Gam family protein [Desulfovibrio sp.]
MAKKPVLHGPVVDDQKQAEGALAEMAALVRKMAQAKLAMQEECDAAKAKANDIITPLEARHKELDAALKKWATMNKSVLFAERKTLDLAFGVIGFIASTKIKQMNGMSEADTLAKLKQFGFVEGIRVMETPDKEAMEKWPDDRLALVGCVRSTTDKWHCKTKPEKLSA